MGTIPLTVTLVDGQPPTTDPPVTLAGGRTVTECVSAVPRPGCVTRTDPDGHQVATFAAMALGMAFIGWRIARGVRRNSRRAGRDSGSTPTGLST